MYHCWNHSYTDHMKDSSSAIHHTPASILSHSIPGEDRDGCVAISYNQT